jgi:hypothetical protein
MKSISRLVALMLLLAGLCVAQGTPATLGNVGVLLDQTYGAGTPRAGQVLADV